MFEQLKIDSLVSKEERTPLYPLTLWFDSAKEGQDFGRLLELHEEIFRRKRATAQEILERCSKFVKHKTDYRKGVYWPLADIERMETLNVKVNAPSSIVRMSEWQHQDFIIANRHNPLLVVEVTEHILTWNNVAQRLPRLVLPVSYGVPSIILQKIDEKSATKYKGWFLQALCRSTEIFNKPTIALLYDDKTRVKAERLLSELSCSLVDFIAFNSRESGEAFGEMLTKISEENQALAKQWYDHNSLKSCRWLDVGPDYVKVIIRVDPADSMWKTKGTGGLDPYPGLVLMADILLCRTGPSKKDRDKKLIVVFERLKEDFWWFRQFPSELYLQLLIDPKRRIADEVIFARG
jgi:hypothetical protein